MTVDTPWNDRMPWVPGNRWDLVSHIEPETPRVSVIVTHYDQPRELARTLEALRRQNHPRDRLEIIVADDGSPDAPIVPEGVRLVRQEDRGFRAAAARNLGAAAASGDVLCFLDADTSPEPEYVRRISRLPALLCEAVTVGRRRHADFAGIPAAVPVEQLGPAHELPEPAWLRDAYARSQNLLRADDRSYRYVISAVVACTRAFFDEVGGFDESFSSYGGEDWEWAHRCWQVGAVFAHVPDAVAWHDGPDWAGRADERAAEGNRQSIRMATKIPVDGSAGRGLLPAVPDIEVSVPVTTTAAAFVCADSLLAALPRATVVMQPLPDEPALRADPRIRSAATTDPRVTVALDHPVVVLRPDALSSALALLDGSDIGRVHFVSAEGTPLGTATSRRARSRRARWDTGAGHRERTLAVEGMHVLRDEPSVEAWLGGWGEAPRFT